VSRGTTIACLVAAATLAGCGGRGQPPSPAPTEDLKVVLMSVPGDPTVSFSLSFAVGSQDDPPGKEGLAFLTGEMLADAATEKRSLDQILEALYPLASSYSMRVDRERTTLTGRTHRDNVAAYFDLFSDAFLKPAFKATDFERVKNDAINELENTLRYSSDEELGKAALEDFVFRGTRYAHPSEGTVEGLRSITLDDVRAFYKSRFTAASALLGLGGGYDDATVARFKAAVGALPKAAPPKPPAIEPEAVAGRSVLLIAKPGADSSISFGFPVDVRRGERDFYALWIANSWLGEHRNQASHLFQVIREHRGLNYGDYSYIEAFARQRAAPRAALRDLDPHAAERQGRIRAARRAARAPVARRPRAH
jgi:zinc protease